MGCDVYSNIFCISASSMYFINFNTFPISTLGFQCIYHMSLGNLMYFQCFFQVFKIAQKNVIASGHFPCLQLLRIFHLLPTILIKLNFNVFYLPIRGPQSIFHLFPWSLMLSLSIYFHSF